MNISGKNAIVTGGVGGIGIALVRELLRNGAQVIEKYFLPVMFTSYFSSRQLVFMIWKILQI